MINNYLPDLDWINLRQWEYYTIQIDWLLSNKIEEDDKQALIKIYNEYNHSNKVIPIQLQEYITSLHKDNELDNYSESSGDPLNEYKTESFQLFEGMLDSLREDVVQKLGQVRPISEEEQNLILAQITEQQRVQEEMKKTSFDTQAPLNTQSDSFNEANPETWGNPGRNSQCPCGSGKKFKHCHGRF